MSSIGIRSDKDSWKQAWAAEDIGFHRAEVNDALVRHWDSTVKRVGKSDNLTVLVPWCGATKDLAWLLDRKEVGRVIGVELVDQALDRLVHENPQLGPLTCADVGDGLRRYETKDGRFLYFLGDFFSNQLLKEVGQACDIVWDRAALVANDYSQMVDYCDRLRQLCNPEIHVLLIETVEYDKQLYSNSPHAITEQDMRDLFEPTYTIERLETEDSPRLADRFRVPVFTLAISCCVKRQ